MKAGKVSALRERVLRAGVKREAEPEPSSRVASDLLGLTVNL